MMNQEQEYFIENLTEWLKEHEGEYAFIERYTLDTTFHKKIWEPETPYFVAKVEKDYQPTFLPGV